MVGLLNTVVETNVHRNDECSIVQKNTVRVNTIIYITQECFMMICQLLYIHYSRRIRESVIILTVMYLLWSFLDKFKALTESRTRENREKRF